MQFDSTQKLSLTFYSLYPFEKPALILAFRFDSNDFLSNTRIFDIISTECKTLFHQRPFSELRLGIDGQLTIKESKYKSR